MEHKKKENAADILLMDVYIKYFGSSF